MGPYSASYAAENNNQDTQLLAFILLRHNSSSTPTSNRHIRMI